MEKQIKTIGVLTSGGHPFGLAERRLFKIIADIHERYVEFFEFAFHSPPFGHPPFHTLHALRTSS